MELVLKSKKQRMNFTCFRILLEWLTSIRPDDNVSIEDMLPQLPDALSEKEHGQFTQSYITRMNQRHLNAFTLRWTKQKVKKVLKRDKSKTIESVTLKDITNVF
jgi:hypothetical protein